MIPLGSWGSMIDTFTPRIPCLIITWRTAVSTYSLWVVEEEILLVEVWELDKNAVISGMCRKLTHMRVQSWSCIHRKISETSRAALLLCQTLTPQLPSRRIPWRILGHHNKHDGRQVHQEAYIWETQLASGSKDHGLRHARRRFRRPLPWSWI